MPHAAFPEKVKDGSCLEWLQSGPLPQLSPTGGQVGRGEQHVEESGEVCRDFPVGGHEIAARRARRCLPRDIGVSAKSEQRDHPGRRIILGLADCGKGIQTGGCEVEDGGGRMGAEGFQECAGGEDDVRAVADRRSLSRPTRSASKTAGRRRPRR